MYDSIQLDRINKEYDLVSQISFVLCPSIIFTKVNACMLLILNTLTKIIFNIKEYSNVNHMEYSNGFSSVDE